MSESKKYDCFRGCEVVDCEDGTTEVTYREGCCKLPVHNYLRDISSLEYADVFEVRFKNTRKGYYKNESGQSVRQGDKVVVEAASGYDLGFVSLEGPLVVKQMQRRRIDPASYEFKKIYRKARPSDIEKWMAATAREQATMIEARRIAATMGLDMKIGDVEFQGDGTKAIFYYIADGRVDFRQLIKVFAEEFRIKIEMKQIGARQEAGLIGGIGVCGRALCCPMISVSAAFSLSSACLNCRLPERQIVPRLFSMNPQKLAGQCGKLKCCINYEVPVYLDAQSRIPKVSEPLEFEDGLAYLRKTDILAEMMYFSYDKSSDANLYPVPAAEVKEIQKMNRNGIRPVSLIPDVEPSSPEFITAVGEGSISRFDSPKKKRKNRKPRDKAQNKQ